MAKEEKDNLVEDIDQENLSSDVSEETPIKGSKKARKRKSDEINEKYDYIIKDKRVRRKTQNRKRATIILIILALLILIGAFIWGITTYLEYNNFKIMIDRDGKNVLSLSPHANLDNKSQTIDIDGPPKMDNISLKGLESAIIKLEDLEGSVENPDMITGTFFLTNVTDKPRSYVESIHIRNATRDIGKAIRVLVISTHFDKDGKRIEGGRVVTCYAHSATKTVQKTDQDGNPMIDNDGKPIMETIDVPELVVPHPSTVVHGYEILHRYEIENNYGGDVNRYISENNITPAPWYTTPFMSNDIIVEKQGGVIGVNEKVRYSIAIWIEGWDSDTVNERLGGTISIDFKFSDAGIAVGSPLD